MSSPAFRGAPEALRAELARTVLEPGRMLRAIDASNHGGGLVRLDKAVETTRHQAVAGVVRRSVLALDLDVAGETTPILDAGLDELAKRALEAGAVDPEFITELSVRSGLAGRVALIEIAVTLLNEGFVPVIIRSGRFGNRHLFCALDDQRLRSQVEQWAKDAGIDVRRGNALIRPPGWPHRLGYEVSVASIGPESFSGERGTKSTTWQAVIAALATGAVYDQTLEQGAATSTQGDLPDSSVGTEQELDQEADCETDLRIHDATTTMLPERLWRLIRYGDVDLRYSTRGRADRSRMTLAICNMAVGAGMYRGHLWNLLVDPRNVGGAGLRARIHSRGVQAAQAWFNQAWDKANDGKLSSRPPLQSSSALGFLCALEELVAQTQFPGASGSTDRAVLGSLIAMGNLAISKAVGASVRRVSVEAGVSHTTAGKSLKRLRAQGWLTLVRCSSESTSAIYLLTTPPGVRLDDGPSLLAESRDPALKVGAQGGQEYSTWYPQGGRRTEPLLRGEVTEYVTSLLAARGHDAFHRQALGKGCLETLGAFRFKSGVSASDIARRTGKCASTVRRHLVALSEAQLVERTDGEWHLVGGDVNELTEHLDEVAEVHGTAGAREARIACYAKEREEYREWLLARLRVAVTQGRVLRDGSTQERLGSWPIFDTEQRRGPPAERLAS